MSVVVKIYKYDSTKEDKGYRGEDFSDYALLASSNIDNLEDTLDTLNITLIGLPFRKEFEPKTKFIVELYDEIVDPDTQEKVMLLWNNEPLHLMVDNDAVQQPIISDDKYFNHNLSLIEASVDTQNRLVDNIAVTYKLQDVTLEEQPTYDLSLMAKPRLIDTEDTSTDFQKKHSVFWNFTTRYMIQGHKFEWVLPDWYDITINDITTTPKNWWETNSLKFYQEIETGTTSKQVSFPAPMLKCSSAVSNSKLYVMNGFCSIDCVITDKNLSTNEQTQTTIQIDPYGADPHEIWNRDYFDLDSEYENTPGVFAPTEYGWIVSRYHSRSIGIDGQGGFWCYPCKVAQNASSMANRVITINVEPNHSYSISFSLHNFNLSNSSGCGMVEGREFSTIRYYERLIDNIPAYYSYASNKLGWTWDYTNDVKYVNSGYPTASINIQGVQVSGKNKVIFASAPPASAYELFNKAQLATQTFFKENDIVVDETNKQIELLDNDKQLLKDTTIIECFYNQKNLWEILLDIGKYIHARPKLKFGKNGKYVVQWKYYGATDQKEDLATPISIYNSKFVEDYICAVSSYVSNMVQLGGTIREIVAPKSSSEDYLVYNNVAEIKTSKNIIEIVDMSVICNDPDSVYYGQSRGLTGKDNLVQFVQVASNGTVTSLGKMNTTGFVFEEGVYKLLDVSPSTNINKGYAIYYTLGTNVIKGLNYRLPTVNTGDVLNDYAIKNIIGCAFGLKTYDEWSNIKVNNYLFDITYRTKDTLRTDQTRPDLRKYLLSTPYDRVPQHNQFANQTDTVIDSIKYGNNIYGTLIRTGNATYKKIEWVNDLQSLKKSGELYSINGEWYYVTKCQNTYYSDHIVSEVDFSKDFNKLSQIIGIPSEPRFYEISEQSLIKREIAINDYIVLGTSPVSITAKDKSCLQGKSLNYIASLLLSPINKNGNTETEETPVSYPRYVVTTLRNDNDKVVQQNTEPLTISLLQPASTYSLQNTLTIEWDMEDNFSAGDKITPSTGYKDNDSQIDTAYNILEAVRYCDKFGRADMFNFAIIDDYSLTGEQVQNLPLNSIDISSNSDKLLFGDQSADFYNSLNTDTNKGIVLLKDNREQLCFNYNLQLLADSDRFVLSSYVWQQGKKKLKLALLNEEVNKISNATIEDRVIQVRDISFDYEIYKMGSSLHYIRINIASALSKAGITDEQLENAKSIAIYSDVFINDSALSSSKYFVVARNIGNLSVSEIKSDWYISPFSSSMFKKQ